MTLKLYGHPLTTCTRRVQVVLEEKQVPYELIVIDTPNREHKTPEYLTKQPFGVLPYLDDDGFIIYESRAICYYIATKFANQGTPGLVPEHSGLKQNALLQQAMSVELSYFASFAEKAVNEGLFKLLHGNTPDEEVYKAAVKILDENFDGYERILSKQRYLAGDNITIADLFHMPYASLLRLAGAPLLNVDSRPNVARWWKDIFSRPSCQKHMYPYEMFAKVAKSDSY